MLPYYLSVNKYRLQQFIHSFFGNYNRKFTSSMATNSSWYYGSGNTVTGTHVSK